MHFRQLVILALSAATLLAGPVRAEKILEPSSEWRLREYDDKCRLSRQFGTGEDSVSLWLDQGGAQQTFNLTLIGEPFANPYGPGIRIKPGAEEEIIRSYIAAKSSKGRPVLKMFGLTLVQPEMKREQDAQRGVATISETRAGSIDTLRISGAGLKPMELKLGPMGSQFGFLQGCGQRLEGVLSEAGRTLTGEAKPPEPIDPDDWLSAKDWPAYLRRAQMAGEIAVRLTISKTGRATGCTVTSSNKPQLFDDAVCLGLLRRAQFKPAANETGEPVASYFPYTVKFYFK